MAVSRRNALGALAALAVAPRIASAQTPPASVPRVGLLIPGPAAQSQNAHVIEAFLGRMKELGYVDGRNVVFEPRFADGKTELLREHAAEFARMSVATIVAFGPGATMAARGATTTIPIVMGNNDPEEQGLIASFAKPGGNITGWAMVSAELAGKQMQLLKETIPRLSKVGVLTNPATPGNARRIVAIEEAARVLNLSMQVIDVSKREDLEPAVIAARPRIEALVVLAEPLLLDQLRPEIVALVARQKLPATYLWRSYVLLGGLMSYGPNLPALARRFAYFTDRILKGAKPADLPVERPTEYEFVINPKTATALGLTIPQTLMLTATEVIR